MADSIYTKVAQKRAETFPNIINDATANKAATKTTQQGALTSIANAVSAGINAISSETTVQTQNIDRRARIRPKAGAESYVYGDVGGRGLLSVLRETNGMLFPSTPTINETHAVTYSSYSPTHTITKFNTYERTENVVLQVSGDYHVTNASEARYLLACIHFIRTVTKMDFGRLSNTRGTPPPVLLFSAYGNFMYHDVPVLIKGATFNFEPDVDYIQVPLLGTDSSMSGDLMATSEFYRIDTDKPDRVWVPTKLTISLSLEQQTTGDWLMTQFDLNSFKRGDLLTKGGLI